MSQVSAHLEQGMMELYQNITMMAQVLDVARLQNLMLTRILIDKKVCTQEEIDERYKKDVEEELKKQHELMKIKLEEQMNAAANEQE